MSTRLPARPNLTHLKRQARKLLDGFRSGSPEALSRVQNSLPKPRSQDIESGADVFGQRDALLVIAREYGYSSWPKLRDGVAEILRASGPPKAGASRSSRAVTMERLYPGLYRFDSKPRGTSQRVSHSYLLIRKAGNLLICNRLAPVTDYLDEIDALGGVAMQLIANYKAAQKGTYHDRLHERFGCELSYHVAEQKMARSKTKCPAVTFGDEGLELGEDFEAIHFPNKMQTGTCLFRWRYRGKLYLFTDGVVSRVGETWNLRFTPDLWPEKLDQLAPLAEMDVDVILAGGTNAGDEETIKLTARSRKAFREAIGSRIKPRNSALKEGTGQSRLRVVTNYLSPALWELVEESGRFVVDKMKVHGNCALPLLMTYLESADVMYFQDFRRPFRPGHAFLPALRDHVGLGGGLVLCEARATCEDETRIAHSHPFPEIGVKGASSDGPDDGEMELVVAARHPVTKGLKVGTRFTGASYLHKNHYHHSYERATFAVGPKGKVLVRNAAGDAVVVAGGVGKGRVVLTGFFFGRGTPLEGAQRAICENAVRWAGGIT